MGQDLPISHRPPVREHGKVRAVSNRLVDALGARAREHGWAIAVHGSMVRDLDLLATPWTQEACTTQDFVEHMRLAAEEELKGDCFVTPLSYDKPHGRVSCNIHSCSSQLIRTIAGAHPFIDMSIVDGRLKDQTDG